MKHNVLITGGTGLIGSHLAKKLQDKGYHVVLLTRKPNLDSAFHELYWDVAKKEIDVKALKEVDYIIHLAGENIGQKRWSKSRKQEIIESRVQSAQLLFENLKNQEKKPCAFIGASAIGYYGSITSERVFAENDPPGNDFLGQTCLQWEQSTNQFANLGIRTVVIRTGLVLSKTGGALGKIVLPIKAGIGQSLGSGRQYVPWIHVDDLCNIYIKAIEEQSMQGPYNAVSPEFITNQQLSISIAKSLNKKFWVHRIPVFVLKLALGEMATIVLDGSRIKPERLLQAGFRFEFPKIDVALKNLLS